MRERPCFRLACFIKPRRRRRPFFFVFPLFSKNKRRGANASVHIRPEIERKLNLGTRTFPEVCTVEAATISPSVQIKGEKERKTRKTRSTSKAVEKQSYRFPRLNIDATPAHSAYFDSKGTLSHQDQTFFSLHFPSIPNLQ